jgi:hypothetical protein
MASDDPCRSDIAESLAELDQQIEHLQFLASLARECGFPDLGAWLDKDLADTRQWRAVVVAALDPIPTLQ